MIGKKLDKKFEALIVAIKEYSPGADIAGIQKAWRFAKLAHTGQKRLTGDSFVSHPLEVAIKLADWKLDSTSIIAALLHDTIEDGGAKREDIVTEFGEEVALLVDGVTKVTTLRLKGSKEIAFVENLRKMLLVMAQDLRVILLKLADRLHNLKTLYALPQEKQVENARETLEIYAPLAERLGMGEVKGELEDLAFPYLYPEEYKRVANKSKPFFKKAEQHIDIMKKKILKKLMEHNIKAEVNDELLEKAGAQRPRKLSWVKQLVEWQKELTDSEEFLRAVKFDALRHRNFVFSPQGDVYDLPAGATPVDFAYAVHTDLGRFISGAKVDGKIVSLDHKLKSGQVVEILKSKNPKGPNSDWLEFVVTTEARREINKYLRKEG